MIKKYYKKLSIKTLVNIALPLFFIFFWLLTIRANLNRIGSFAFFDEYSTYVTGFFMLKGRVLFSEIFLNHQLILPYISYYLQLILQPESFYVLATQHRLAVLAVSILMSFLMVLRFRFIGVFFSIFFESTKFYLFGTLFLAESLIVYPLAYMLGLIILGDDKKFTFKNYELYIAAFITWFIFFIREPYAPLALMMFAIIFFQTKEKYTKIISALLLSSIFVLTIIRLPLYDYLHQLITINANTVGGAELKNNSVFGIGILKIFFYPVYILITGNWNFFHMIQMILSVVFIMTLSWFILIKKEYKKGLYIFIILALANIRFVEPGEIYFAAFHMLPWMSLFIMSIFSLFYFYLNSEKIKKSIPIFILLSFAFMIGILHPDTYILNRLDKESEFNNNYIRYRSIGEVVGALSVPGDKLFVDLSDSLVHYYSDLDSAYKYAFFYPVMTSDKLFLTEREKMFTSGTPEFYYHNCSEELSPHLWLPDKVKNKYTALDLDSTSTCLYIRNDKVKSLSKSQLDYLSMMKYTLDAKVK